MSPSTEKAPEGEPAGNPAQPVGSDKSGQLVPPSPADQAEGLPLKDKVEQSADKRAAFTRNYLSQNDQDIVGLCNTLGKEPFNIIIKQDDDKSLALGIFALQKQLGFPEEDHAQGCDGKFGPYTSRAFEARNLGQVSGERRSGLADDLADGSTIAPASDGKSVKPSPAKTSGDEGEEEAAQPDSATKGSPSVVPDVASPSEPAPSIEKNPEFPPVNISETIFIGDSLTQGMKDHLKGARRQYAGGSSTYSMLHGGVSWINLPTLEQFLSNNQADISKKRLKRAVVTLGTNDITNCRGDKDSISSVTGRLGKIVDMLKSSGLQVVLNTIPYSNLEKRLSHWHKVHGDQYFRDLHSSVSAADLSSLKQTYGPNPSYELALAILKLKVEKVNDFILGKAGGNVKVYDLYTTTMNDQHGYQLSKDGLHYTSKGSSELAKTIREKAGISS